MWYRIGVDLVLLLHPGFVLFVIGGGLLLVKWRGMVWIHLPAVAWGALVEFMGWICPLTPLENRLRALAGESADGSRLHRPLPSNSTLSRDTDPRDSNLAGHGRAVRERGPSTGWCSSGTRVGNRSDSIGYLIGSFFDEVMTRARQPCSLEVTG